MKPLRSLVRALIFAFFALMLTTTAFAQSPEPVIKAPPSAKPGICAPWHACIAKGLAGLIVLYLLFAGGMYLYQRRGFDRLEHRQGNPDGVPVNRE